jgi:predicted O-linked N-acetylglucosamine transferase (SPINDLY family)
METPDKLTSPAGATALEEAFSHHSRGNLPIAERLYEAILSADADDIDALHLLGVLRKQQGRYEEAIRLIEAAIRLDPDYVEAHVNLGLALNDIKRHEDAIASYRRALAVEPGCVEAHYNMGVVLGTLGRGEEAVASYRSALAISPDHVEAHYNLGVLLGGLKRHEEAVACIESALALRPDYARAHFVLGAALRELGRLAAAEASYRRALEIQPDYAEVHGNLGVTLKELGRPVEAEASHRRALAIKPDDAETHNNLGSALQDQGRFAEAEASYRRALAIRPDFAEVHSNLGTALREQGRPVEAEASHRRAMELKPEYAGAHNNLGSALQTLGRLSEALASYRRALELTPDYHEAHTNLGNALYLQGRFAEAEASHRRALAIKPDFAEAHSNLGNALFFQGRLAEADASHRRALQLDPNSAGAHSNLGNGLLDLGRLAEAEASFRRALALAPDFPNARSNLLLALNYTERLSRAALFEEHRAWSQRHEAPLAAQRLPHPNSRDPQRRLRVGYVSPDFRRHSVACFIEPVLARHDRNAFEVYCYSNVIHPDRVTERLLALADGARSIVGLSDAQAAAQVRADGMDILVDLAGHTARGRLGVFALKPAPVQASYLGYPNTSGLSAIDWRVTDVHADPPGDGDAFHSERLARLPQTFLCYRPPEEAPAVEPAPFLQKGYITFGSFNVLPKVTAEVIRVWAQLLERVPGSRLMLKGRGLGGTLARAHLLGAFAQHGIAEDRLTLLPHDGDFRAHLSRYREMDIGLDPFPYNGTTTTCEALWMGVPVVALAGERHAGRVGASILANLGLEELIAKSVEHYLSLAAALAADGARLASLRETMRARVTASPLRDEAGFAHSLEAAYREMWRRWCCSEPSAPLDVALA